MPGRLRAELFGGRQEVACRTADQRVDRAEFFPGLVEGVGEVFVGADVGDGGGDTCAEGFEFGPRRFEFFGRAPADADAGSEGSKGM